MSTIYTNWTNATNNPSYAMVGLISCLESGKNAWIEVRKNGEQDFPIKMKNPALENPFNWTMAYGTPRNIEEQLKRTYFNDTEKDMTCNWVACYGEKDAIEKYQADGTISDGMFKGGICHPVRIEDANYYREHILGDGYKYGVWSTNWKAKDGIPYYVVDESIGDVFTICYTDESVSKVEAIRKASQFLLDYAEKMEEQNER